MKYILFSLMFALSLSLFCKEFVPYYTITSSKEDKTLKKTQSVFVLIFYNSKGKPVNQEIVFSYNGIQKKQKTNEKGEFSLFVKPGKYVFNFFLDLKHYEINTDSILTEPGFRTEMQVSFNSSIEPVLMKKPVIYIYPEKEQKVSVQLKLKGDFLFTYPEYNNGWNFTAQPDGSIQMNDKKYKYLFWDGKVNIETSKLNLQEGFVVAKKDLVEFFEDKLSLMGLNSREIEDYITFWCPLMNQNEKNYIHFMFTNEYAKYATITIDPKPDHLFRVCMLWSNAEDVNSALLKDQQIENFKRDGFTVVEWGGAEMEEAILSEKL